MKLVFCLLITLFAFSAEPAWWTAQQKIDCGLSPILDYETWRAQVQAEDSKTWRAQVQAEIQGIQEALKQLNKSMSLDADERGEWEKRSADALRDAYVLGANATLDLMAAHTQHQIVAEDVELKQVGDRLSGEMDHNRREQLHAAFKALNDRKEELKRIKDNVDKAHDAVDILGKTQNIAYGQGQEQSKNLIEAAWDACDNLKILPEWASQAKAIVDASYDITLQFFSVQHINSINANSEQYLKAVKVLSKRMETLVKLKKLQARTIGSMGPEAPGHARIVLVP